MLRHVSVSYYKTIWSLSVTNNSVYLHADADDAATTNKKAANERATLMIGLLSPEINVSVIERQFTLYTYPF